MLINGSPGYSVSVEDRGLLYGDGVFETILCEAGKAILLAGHMQRLQNGCERLGLPKLDQPTVLSEIREVAQHDDCIVKVIITRGERERGYAYDSEDMTCTRIVTRSELPKIPLINYTDGINLTKCQYQLQDNKQLAGIKHLNRLDQVLARSEWNSEFQEGLMFAGDGRVVEGTMTNIFIESNQKWLTPSLEHAGVKGVMRQWIMRNSFLVDTECEELDIQLSDIINAEAVFVCNSVIGIWPVMSFDERSFNVSENVRQLMNIINSKVSCLYPHGLNA